MKNILLIICIFISTFTSASSATEKFQYGPPRLNDYNPTSGLISDDVELPNWLKGTWWAQYYKDTGMTELAFIPRPPKKKMGRPFEFYSNLIRVPEGDNEHIDFKPVAITEMSPGKAWVLNMVSYKNPNKGADLVINKSKAENADSDLLVLRWREGIFIHKKTIFAVSIGVGSILQFPEKRQSYLSEKYIKSKDSEKFDYQKWHNNALNPNTKSK